MTTESGRAGWSTLIVSGRSSGPWRSTFVASPNNRTSPEGSIFESETDGSHASGASVTSSGEKNEQREFELTRRNIVERRFEKAIQACLDVASHVVATEGFREPTDYGDLFRILEENDVLSPATADRMVEIAGVRNVLATE